MADDPKADFRYTKGDIEIEGYQITPASRWQQQLWPDWLKMQRLTDDVNVVYTDSSKPDKLWFVNEAGEQIELPYLAWFCKHSDGSIGIIDALEMEEYVKVVPIPPPVVHPEAGAAPPALAVVPALKSVDEVIGDGLEMRNEMLSAIKLLHEGTPEEALSYLKARVAARTKWCDCTPGQCSNAEEAGCREHSLLL